MVGAGVDDGASCEEAADGTVGSVVPASSATSGSPMSADTVRGMPRRLASSHKIARAKATNCCVDSDGTCRRSIGRPEKKIGMPQLKRVPPSHHLTKLLHVQKFRVVTLIRTEVCSQHCKN